MVSDPSLGFTKLWTVCWSIAREIEACTNAVSGHRIWLATHH